MELAIGCYYRHFKGNIYKVIGIAKDSENLSYMVVYENVLTKELWVREKDMFLSKVDKEKYPDVTQEYRFQKLDNYCMP